MFVASSVREVDQVQSAGSFHDASVSGRSLETADPRGLYTALILSNGERYLIYSIRSIPAVLSGVSSGISFGEVR